MTDSGTRVPLRAGGDTRWSLARRLFVLQAVIVIVVILAGSGLAWYSARAQNQEAARGEVRAVAKTLAGMPALRSALDGADPSDRLQPLAERTASQTGVDFVTIMSKEGIRYTHPDPSRIGERFWGHIEPAVRGNTFTETYAGTLGPSVRAVAPVLSPAGRVTALVSVGIRVRVLTRQLQDQLRALLLVAGLALLFGGLATYLVSVRMRRYTHGLSPAALSRVHEYHEAILHAVREGLLLVSPRGVVTLCNDGAAVLLGLDPALTEGRRVDDLGLPDSLAAVLGSRAPVRDELHLSEDRVLLVTVVAAGGGNGELGNVVTLRDHTELRTLNRELDTLRGFSESLRSQAHESANRLHTIVSMIELGRTEQAVEFATSELRTAQQLTDRVVGAVEEPVLAAVLLGKTAEARERGVEIGITEDTRVDESASEAVDPRELVTVLGNLIDNAVEAVLAAGAGSPAVDVTLRAEEEGLLVRVVDNGPGVDTGTTRELFRRGRSGKGDGRGLGLALVGQSVRRHGGHVEVANDTGRMRGAAFTAWLPLEPLAGREPKAGG
ncbi:sensor histidine kinase regulating citrate/malate metabolism [Actinopolyspora biskrensis]|uniref:histidine kinase n=1 Tax=Actinopolyspora biskrensis TaxID=1470178 RepID=A0A852YWG5_9ACTN|nr:sensor histidine kinase [Actinopolyspora biskrensis]NYH78072.1 sensor histidine kinase regulating citrate/malate metabolism [Actinopolyspora biskrensis]